MCRIIKRFILHPINWLEIQLNPTCTTLKVHLTSLQAFDKRTYIIYDICIKYNSLYIMEESQTRVKSAISKVCTLVISSEL